MTRAVLRCSRCGRRQPGDEVVKPCECGSKSYRLSYEHAPKIPKGDGEFATSADQAPSK